MDEDAPWPQDPHDFYYKIDIGNVFRYVYLTKAYELIALEFEAYILDNWNDTRRPCLEIMVARTNELLSNCLYDHKLKKIVFKAMIKSGKTDETIPPPPPANTSESTNNNDEEELDSEDEEEETDSESEDEDDESDSESDEE
tara:strand:+ start:2551 stop:2976 length:426 start_codon:yes stop_codon:yes gene_type:complete